jgi:hypothetical protein
MARTRDIKLSRDWRGLKAGDVVVLDNVQFVEALDAGVIRKVYPGQVGAGIKRNRLRTAASKTAANKTTAPRAAKKSTPAPSAPSGDEQ